MLDPRDARRIIEEVVRQAGGTMSSEGEQLMIDLPKPAESVPPAAVESPDHTGRKLVLHVEDTDRGGDLIYYYLRNYYEVDSATDADMAIRKVLVSDYDLILVDIDLGAGMNGIELTRVIRQIERYQSVPIIAITGHSGREIAQQCLDAGCNAYLAKPFLKDDLFRAINTVMTNFDV